MSNEIIPFESFPAPSTLFAKSSVDVEKFMGGIQASFAILTIKGKTWGIRYRGVTQQLTEPNAAAGGALFPVQFLDVVIVDAAATISKVWYEHGYVDGQRTPPDCWSANGVVPDPASPKRQASTCRGCQWNVFGSKIGDGGQKGKACPDNKRLAIVPLTDIKNEAFGGPVMLRLPPGSFSPYSEFVGKMASRQYPPFAVACRLTFAPNEAYPRVLFTPLRPLNDQEAALVLEVQGNPQLERMLSDPAIGAFADAEADEAAPAGGVVPPPPNQTQNAPAAQAAPVQQAPPPPPPVVVTPPPPPPPVTQPVTGAPVATGFGVAVASGGGAQPQQQGGPAPGTAWGSGAVAPAQPQPQAPAQAQDDLAIPEALRRAPAAQPITAPPPQQQAQPEVLTPEQMKIRELEAALAAATAGKKATKPRAKPVAPAAAATVAAQPGAQVVTPASNGGAGPALTEPPPTPAEASVGNAIADRIAGLVGKT